MATALKLPTAALSRPVTRRAAGVTLSSSLLAATLLPHGIALAQKVTQPKPGAAGTWRLIGQTHADHGADHDTIVVQGPYDNFRKIKFKVTDAPRMTKSPHTAMLFWPSSMSPRAGQSQPSSRRQSVSQPSLATGVLLSPS